MTKEYIEREALKQDLKESYDRLRAIYDGLTYDEDKQICAGQLTTFTEAILRVKEAPAADVAPVVHAKWDANGRCTNCGGHAPYYSMASTYHESPYCFECGARMDKDEV